MGLLLHVMYINHEKPGPSSGILEYTREEVHLCSTVETVIDEGGVFYPEDLGYQVGRITAGKCDTCRGIESIIDIADIPPNHIQVTLPLHHQINQTLLLFWCDRK